MNALSTKLGSHLQTIAPGQHITPAGGYPDVLSIHRSTLNRELYTLVPFGPPHVQAPIYSAKLSKITKPHVIVWKGNAEVATVRMHSFSSKLDFCIHGQTIPMSESNLSGNTTIQHPRLGPLKWKANQLTGTSSELIDNSGTIIARLKPNHVPGMGKKKLELLVPCDQIFLDLVVASAMAVMLSMQSTLEAAGDAIGAVVDVSGS